MATPHPPTIFKVWKEHRCIGCGLPYRYRFTRMRFLRDSRAVHEQVEDALLGSLVNKVQQQPCPDCGRYQPDMIAARRWRRHWWVTAISLVGLLLLTTLVLSGLLTLSPVSWWALCFVALLSLVRFLIDRSNPNANLAANRKLARQREDEGIIRVEEENHEPEQGTPPGNTNRLTSWHLACYLVCAVSLLLLAAPLVYRETAGLVSNPGWSPDVVGPGDETLIYFGSYVRSVDGLWRGRPRVIVVNAAELGLPEVPVLTATTRNATWGPFLTPSKNSIDFAPLWAYVQVPDNPALAGKTLDLRIDMDVKYPERIAPQNYVVKLEAYSCSAKLVLSSPGAGQRWWAVWWKCFVPGVLLALLGGALLAFCSRLHDKTPRTSLFVRRRAKGGRLSLEATPFEQPTKSPYEKVDEERPIRSAPPATFIVVPGPIHFHFSGSGRQRDSAVFKVAIWKEHECAACGLAYCYRLERKKVGYGSTPERAEANARAAALKSIGNEVEMQPCPGCGCYQPDMIAQRRWRRHLILLAGGYFLPPLFILALTDLIAWSLAAVLAACVGAALGLVHLLIDRNPNANRAANRDRAAQTPGCGRVVGAARTNP